MGTNFLGSDMCYILGFYKQLLGKIGRLLIIKKIGIKILKDDTCWNLGNWKNLLVNDFKFEAAFDVNNCLKQIE